MFDFIRNWWNKPKTTKADAYIYNGITLLNINCYYCNEQNHPGVRELLAAFKSNLKANGIELYADKETFSKFVNMVMLTDDFETFLSMLYLCAYEKPNEKILIYPGDEFNIGVLIIEHNNDDSEDKISLE